MEKKLLFIFKNFIQNMTMTMESSIKDMKIRINHFFAMHTAHAIGVVVVENWDEQPIVRIAPFTSSLGLSNNSGDLRKI